MDADRSFPRVDAGSAPEVAPRQIIIGGVPFDDETQADFVDLLGQAVALLCFYLLQLLSALRVLRLQVIELRCQAHYWEVQHQRACEREAKLKAQLEHSTAASRKPPRPPSPRRRPSP
jgi:hypothetical protein